MMIAMCAGEGGSTFGLETNVGHVRGSRYEDDDGLVLQEEAEKQR